MQITDAIADMLTRIRNAGRAGHPKCDIPASKMKRAIAEILVEEGYIQSVTFQEDNKQGILTVTLKYIDKKPVINGIQRVSKPGLRVYADLENLPKVLGGLGIAIISTSRASRQIGRLGRWRRRRSSGLCLVITLKRVVFRPSILRAGGINVQNWKNAGGNSTWSRGETRGRLNPG